MKYSLLNFLFLVLLSGAPVWAESLDDTHAGQWQVGLSFGEIPILAGSFKPGLTVGYHLDEHFFLGLDIQAHDNLQRDGSSFNARNTGFDGLDSSRERTGMRAWFGLRWKARDWAPYLSLGAVLNRDDRETMAFDSRAREIGSALHEGPLVLEQTRPGGGGLALGLGYQHDFDGPLSLHTGFAMAVFAGIPEPEVAVVEGVAISAADRALLTEQLQEAFKHNNHNHYHIFNIGLGYRFD